MCQVVAYWRLKATENFKTVSRKRGRGWGGRWSFTRVSSIRLWLRTVFVFWEGERLREVVARGGSTVLLTSTKCARANGLNSIIWNWRHGFRAQHMMGLKCGQTIKHFHVFCLVFLLSFSYSSDSVICPKIPPSIPCRRWRDGLSAMARKRPATCRRWWKEFVVALHLNWM